MSSHLQQARPRNLTPRLLAALAGLALAAGFHVWSRPGDDRAPAATNRESDQLERLREENQRLAATATGAIVEPPSTVANGELGAGDFDIPTRSAALRLLGGWRAAGFLAADPFAFSSNLPSAAASGRPGYSLTNDHQLLPAFGEIFALSVGEVSALQGQIDDFRKRFEADTVARTSVRRGEDGTVVLESLASPRAEDWKQEFLAVFRTSLGDERFKAFLQLHGALPGEESFGGTLNSRFQYFGSNTQTITLTRTGDALRYRNQSNTATGESRGSSNGSVGTRQQLIERLGAAATLLPEDF